MIGHDWRSLADRIAERGIGLGKPLELFDDIDSTNDALKRAAKNGAAHGTLYVAESQSRGRGRQGRSWLGERGESILASVLLRIDCEPRKLPPLAIVAGLSARDAIGGAAKIKWPNDVLIDGKKVAGILVEAREWAVLGIGVNVAVDVSALPPDAAGVAGTLGRDEAEVEPTLAELLSALEARLSEEKAATLTALRERDALLGKPVRWDGGEGLGAGIDDAGALLVHLPDGTTTALSAGEVTLTS